MHRLFALSFPLLVSWLIAIDAMAQSSRPSNEELAAMTYKAQELLDRYYGNSKDLAQAQQHINDVFHLDPQFVPAYIQATRVVIMGGRIVSHQFADGTLEGAEQILLQARNLEPSNAEVHGLLGHVYFLSGRLEAALESLDKSKQLKSSNPWLNNNYGDVYQRLRKYDFAEDHYQRVTSLGPGTSAQQRRAYVYALMKRQWLAALREDNPEVVRLGKMATDAAPVNDAWTWGDVANVLFIQGYFDESIANARKALSIMDYGVGRNNLALGLYGKWASLVANGRGAEAEKYFVEAFSLNPDLTRVVQRFRQSAKVVVDLAPIVQKRQSEIR